MSVSDEDEEQRLRSVALQNAYSILVARRRAEEELRKQSEWLQITLASIGDAVISTDAASRITFMNGIAESLTGWHLAEASGRLLPEVFRIFAEDGRRPVETPSPRALSEGGVVGLAQQTVLIAKDGRQWPIEDSAAPIRDAAGMVSGMVLVFREISQRKRSEADLAHLLREVQSERERLAEVVLNAVEATRPFTDEAGHKVTVTLPDQPIMLDADPSRLAQILSNLLSNAAKYTQDGCQIWLTAEQDHNEVVVSVKDTGLGVPPDMQKRIFEMFTQIDRTMEKGYTGLGIGLTLVKRLVEMHGGTISVHSEGANQGSEFRVRLPIRIAQDTPEQQADSSQPGTAVSRLRILVVDDNIDAAKTLGMVIKALGNEVRTANDGQHAIEMAGEFRPDLVLMDIGMPRMNGYEAAQHIRQQTWGNGMVLVALTGWGQEEDRQRTQEAGFDHHLVKPAEPAALQELFTKVRVKGGASK